MRRPYSQRIFQLLVWTVVGGLGLGALLDALVNASEIFSLSLTLVFTVVVGVLWLAIELVLKARCTSWALAGKNNNTVILTRLGPRSRAAILGVVLLPWGAQALRYIWDQQKPATTSTGSAKVDDAVNVQEQLSLACQPRPRFVVGVGSQRLGVDDELDRHITIDCDLANVGRERLSIVKSAFTVEYSAPSKSVIPLEPGSDLDNRVELPALPLVLDQGVVHRFSLSFRIIRDQPGHFPALAVETSNAGALLFPSAWRTKLGPDGEPHRVEPHHLSGFTLCFGTARQVTVRKAFSLAELEKGHYGGLTKVPSSRRSSQPSNAH
jgi:hypothetical protein